MPVCGCTVFSGGCAAGLAQVDDQIGKLTSHVLDRRLVQVVMARTSDLLGKTVRETRFRRRFDAAIIALHREGQRIRQKIGDITLAVRCELMAPRSQLLQPHTVPPNGYDYILPTFAMQLCRIDSRQSALMETAGHDQPGSMFAAGWRRVTARHRLSILNQP